MDKSLKLTKLQKIAEGKGGKCLSDHYVNSRTKIKFQCSKGHPPWETLPRNVQVLGTWCPTCSGDVQQSISDMHKLATQKHGKCLSKKYVNSRTKLVWQCSLDHPPFEATPSQVKHSGRWCPVCTGNEAITIDDMHKLAKLNGGKCLSKNYVSAKKHLTWQCSENHPPWQASPSNIKSGHWCPRCAKRPKVSLNDMHEIAALKNGKCLSKEYENAHKKLKWQCSLGHTWLAAPNKVKQSKWCPECAAGKSENMCRAVFEQLFGRPFPTKRPNWLKSSKGFNLELDGFCEQLNLAFEYQGEQHFQAVNFSGKKLSDIQSQLKRDQAKKDQCAANGVILVVINYDDDLTQLPEIIKSRLKAKRIDISHIDFNQTIDFSVLYEANSKLEEMKQLARSRGGVCLSSAFISVNLDLEWQCSEGHIWSAPPQRIKGTPKKKGTWCKKCFEQRNYGSQEKLVECQKIAESRGGKCLSTVYEGIMKHLSWQCAQGHIWRAAPNNVKNNGTWCRKCSWPLKYTKR